jgi:predicted AAA+ superfamily ATPase
LFSSDWNVEHLILGLELYSCQKTNPSETLVIFDEVQEVPRALTSLKYFNENAPQYNILCVGTMFASLSTMELLSLSARWSF